VPVPSGSASFISSKVMLPLLPGQLEPGLLSSRSCPAECWKQQVGVTAANAGRVGLPGRVEFSWAVKDFGCAPPVAGLS